MQKSIKKNISYPYLAGFADNIEEWEFDAAWYEALFWPLDGATVDEVVDEAEEDEE